MTHRVYQRAVKSDLIHILSYLKFNAGEAVSWRYARRFQTSFDRIKDIPKTGSPRPRLGRVTRCVRVQPYLIFYDYDAVVDVVNILRVIHSHRKITKASLKP